VTEVPGVRARDRLRGIARRAIPFRLRLGLARLRRLPRWIAERGGVARLQTSSAEVASFGWLLAAHSSPLERVPGALPGGLQRGKEANLRLAAKALDRVVVAPNQVFSHHHAIGRPTRVRGYRMGLELRDGEPRAGIGGGLCQVSNTFHWVALRAGMRIVERHRHGLDLFPDHARTVPFGCGATVAYNYADLRFENPYPQPVLIRARVEAGAFVGELWAARDPGVRVEVEETGHRFFREAGGWMRENHLRRRIRTAGGDLLVDEEVAHNRCRVRYEPTEEQLRSGAA
jgi:vancomycin resistance protein VanW